MVQLALSFSPPSEPRAATRSQFMGRNLLELAKRAPQGKFVFWAHDVHIAVRSPMNEANFGSELGTSVIGPSLYYAMGLQFGSGSRRRCVVPMPRERWAR